jgi:hypothetical protein
MTTTPAGRPAWSRTAAIEDFGGHLNKVNFQSQGVVNPRTDVGAEAIARQSADQVACSRTAPFVELVAECNDGSPAAPTVEYAAMMTGVRTSSYEADAPPTGFPSATRGGSGHVVFTFESEYEDEYGIAEAFTPRGAHVTCEGATFADGTYEISGQTVIVRIFNAAGTPLADRRFSLSVW